jgi:hypothetical protein
MSLTSYPLWVSGLILVGGATLIAMAGPVVIRRFITLDRLRTNNEVAGFKFATVGVLYAVILGFAVIVVWEKFSDAENEVAREAGAAVSVYRLSKGLDGQGGTLIRSTLTEYLDLAVSLDWPAMEKGRSSAKVTQALNYLYTGVLLAKPSDQSALIVVAEILRQLDALAEARRARLVMANGTVPDIVWMVLFGGATITIGFTFFFGTTNLLAQTLMTGCLSLLVLSALLTIIAIDQPFAGTVKVRPDALLLVLNDFRPSP